MSDIDLIIERLSTKYPDIIVDQLVVQHPGSDDDGLWFFSWLSCPNEVQVESPNGMCPFLIESDEEGSAQYAESVDQAIYQICQSLHLNLLQP